MVVDRSSASCGARHSQPLYEMLGQRGLFSNLLDAGQNLAPTLISPPPEIIILRVTVVAEGRELIAQCRSRWHDASIVLILCRRVGSAGKDLQSLVELSDDFLFCSAIEPELALRGARLLGCRRSKSAHDQEELHERLRGLPLVGGSPVFIDALHKAANFARNDATVLITGETGSGKELFARAIHYQGPRHAQPFVPVNCGALPDHLFENELFGHVKGAFTDARWAEKGLIAEAEGGTLFLDEIDSLSLAAQVKLLRFLQNGEYRPLGSARALMANVRVIAATNADLKSQVELKRFREDLFYRLNVLSVAVPPLRARGDDVIPLAEHFLRRYSGGQSSGCPSLSEMANRKLIAYSWPGNVRELEGVIQSAVLLKPSGVLHAADIALPEGKSKEMLRHESLRRAKSFVIGEFERGYVANLLAQHQGNITRAAKAAGKDRRTLQRLVRKYSLDRESFKY
ncbi:MAG: sigma-54 interaction domain-containing protein [Chloroflexota bacterium]